jgi:hypothetical protein
MFWLGNIQSGILRLGWLYQKWLDVIMNNINDYWGIIIQILTHTHTHTHIFSFDLEPHPLGFCILWRILIWQNSDVFWYCSQFPNLGPVIPMCKIHEHLTALTSQVSVFCVKSSVKRRMWAWKEVITLLPRSLSMGVCWYTTVQKGTIPIQL